GLPSGDCAHLIGARQPRVNRTRSTVYAERATGVIRIRLNAREERRNSTRQEQRLQGRLAAVALAPNRPARLRLRPISIVTVAVMPARSGGSPERGKSRTLTGSRCTPLTQFPEAFCGSRIANSAPVAGLMLSTSASQATSG